MARKLRIEFAGAVYHVISRGDRGEGIYQDDEDRRLFLQKKWGQTSLIRYFAFATLDRILFQPIIW